jgi:hypothetical protein
MEVKNGTEWTAFDTYGELGYTVSIHLSIKLNSGRQSIHDPC